MRVFSVNKSPKNCCCFRRPLLLFLSICSFFLSVCYGQVQDGVPHFPSPFSNTDILDVDLQSNFCNGTTTLGKICDFSRTNKTIRIPLGLKYSETYLFSIEYVELQIIDAAAVHLYPTCISWIQVKNARYLTTFPPSSSPRMHELLKDDPTERFCRTWLRVYDSIVDDISNGVADLLVKNCVVSKINLRNQRDIMSFNSTIEHIEWLDWEGYKGHIENTNINKITKFLTSSGVLIEHSEVGTVERGAMVMNGSDCYIYDSNFDLIESEGITFMEGLNELKNIEINTLQKFGIVTDAMAKLKLKNVVIHNATSPAFKFYLAKRVLIDNVTIEGEPLKLNSKWIWTPNEWSQFQEISEDMKRCSRTEESFTCNLKNISKKILLDLENMGSHRNITIKNAEYLIIKNLPCQMELIIVNSNVSFITDLNNSNPSNNCDSVLRSKRSYIEDLISSTFTTIELDTVHIKRLTAYNISTLHVKYSYVAEVVALVTRKHSRCNIKFTHIENIRYAVFAGPLHIENSQIYKISKQLVLGNHEKVSVFTNSSFHDIPYKGIHLISGHLRMINIKLKSIMEEAIYLEPNATIEINNLNSFPRLERSCISVVDKIQVAITMPLLPITATDWLVHVRQTDNPRKKSENIFLLNSTTSNQFCRIVDEVLLSIQCDFQNLEVAVHIPEPASSLFNLTLSNISYLTLHPTCASVIVLTNVENGNVLPSNSSLCVSVVQVFDSRLQEIRYGAPDIFIFRSNLKTLSPTTRAKNVLIEKSNVSTIDGLEFLGRFEVSESTIESTEMMIGLPESIWLLTNSNLLYVDLYGISIKDKAIISNSVINKIASMGLTIEGELNITNTVLENVEERAIVIKGILNMHNVTIKNGSRKGFLVETDGIIRCRNVYLQGQKIVSNTFMDYEQTTIITPNKHVPERASSTGPKIEPTVIPDALITQNESSGLHHSTPETIQKPVTTARTLTESAVKVTDEGGKEAEEPRSGSHVVWIAILGFLLGVTVTFGAMYAVMLFRPNLKNLIPSSFLWTARNDEHELIPSEEELTSGRVFENDGL